MAVPAGLTRWPRTVVLVGVASLLNDVASEMVVPVLPAFVAGLGGGGLALGAIDGVAELVAAGLKGWSGRASDRRGTSRPFVLGGYAIAAAARPLLVAATLPWHVVAVRALDRVGKGLRSSPRDALLAASVPPEQRGAAFGFHRRMDHTGAMLGPVLTLGLLWGVGEDLRWVFAAAALPGLAALIAVAAIDEAPRPPAAADGGRVELARLWASAPFALAALAAAGDLFLLARITERAGTPLAAPALWIALHLVRQEAAGRAGAWADAVRPAWVVAGGFGLRAVAAVGLAVATHPLAAAAAALVHGLGAASEGAERKLVAARAGAGAGRAFGAYHLSVGLAAMVGGLSFGALWDAAGPPAAFAASAVGTAAAALWVLAADRRAAP